MVERCVSQFKYGLSQSLSQTAWATVTIHCHNSLSQFTVTIHCHNSLSQFTVTIEPKEKPETKMRLFLLSAALVSLLFPIAAKAEFLAVCGTAKTQATASYGSTVALSMIEPGNTEATSQ